ncbi:MULTISPECIES: sigma-54-dependent transcriptional regulator [Delftia]|uniref:Sigma-54-dependent Fis family transcriptional regulator n=2 Tax=Delftia tsuruhatensis TaxID=180282 RepID=A0ABN4SKE4_9BURK|nr:MULTISPECIES: sigma-54 dependent transcriptional regulator [Delftia]KEH11596.1 ATPase AAA [Delftia sp. 670]MPT04549.1 sigma-54-dependent Fis family transcriptional regulator [Delftia sp.]AOV02489.1 sigma-54-dependent Fis family transcriptional regulator [Delftia tsuruhatensis]KLO60911.1 ATPase AAA [Delftia tsuruhatensis]MDH2233561.1 sigma-54 dependent transcriptional regulator [Delftia tsuruhatensis]
MARILIVDDDTAFRESLAEMLGDLGHGVSQAPTVAAGLQILQAGSVDAAIVDLRMPGEDGLAFLRKARGLSRAPCIMLTAYASGGNTIEAMRLGAFDHLTKPIARTALVEALDRALQGAGPAQDCGDGQAGQPQMHDDGELVSGSEAMRQVFKRIGLAADSDATVLVLGETGTGKELVARALHRNSARAERPFVAVNCAAIPADLMESELFGHVKGAFTGAVSDRAGRFREAQGGTLFLDEVGDMPLPTQAKILRALQEREITPVGASRALPVNVRIIAATHRDLPDAVRQGRFREDLWYRLQVVPVHLPPLRERLGDVLLLAEHFLRQGGGASPKRLGADAARLLLAHDWPGNVRELRNAMERAALLCPGPVIGPEHIGLQPAAANGPAIDWNGPLAPAVAQLEREMVTRALAATMGNRAEAARRLGLSRQQLYRKLAEFGLG